MRDAQEVPGSSLHGAADPELLDVRGAAVLLGRHPETVRRWIWSGRLVAERRGNRLVVARSDLEALAGLGDPAAMADLTTWARQAGAARAASGAAVSGQSASDLVLEDRDEHGRSAGVRARR